jgi:threonine/homoserine/homoserine lactone efflux protein
MVILSLAFMAMTLIIFILYGLMAHGLRRHGTRSPRLTVWAQRSFAAAFAALGVKLAVTER